jgi:hypothetical protein
MEENEGLKIVEGRFVKDNYYPEVKAFNEYTIEDLNQLHKDENLKVFEQILNALREGDQNSNMKYLTKMMALAHDYSYSLSKKIMEKAEELGFEPSSLMLNYLMSSAVAADETDEMFNLLFRASVSDIRLDLNTYWRYCFRVYDSSMPMKVPETELQISGEEQKKLLIKLYTMI